MISRATGSARRALSSSDMSDDDEIEKHAHHARGVAIDPAAIEGAAAFFRAAGDPARLRLLVMLQQGEWCVTELAAETGEGLSTISQRLRVLRSDGLVSRRREGKHLWYSLADAHVAELISNALEHAKELGK
jgi:ArsR family transcriptional regulator, lead/cadmium/zinc/bismuth-responsive transcriptional repressor